MRNVNSVNSGHTPRPGETFVLDLRTRVVRVVSMGDEFGRNKRTICCVEFIAGNRCGTQTFVTVNRLHPLHETATSS